ncbi:MAG: regulator of replication initiation timing, partial [Pirellulaceae bacterium]
MNETSQPDSATNRDDLATILASHRERAARLLESQRSRVQRFDQLLNRNFDEFVAQAATISGGSSFSQPQNLEDDSASIRPLLDSFWERLEERFDDIQNATAQAPPQDAAVHEPNYESNREHQNEIDALEEQVRSLQQQLRSSVAEKGTLTTQIDELKESLGHEQPVGLDWEAEKRRVLAALEADVGEVSEASATDRSDVQNTIRISDRIIAEKDREISELNRLLEHQSGNIGEVAIGAAAIGATLDNNELIQQERGRLVHLQQEWTEKLRKAEVEISIERATFARQKAAFMSEKQKITELLEKNNLS